MPPSSDGSNAVGVDGAASAGLRTVGAPLAKLIPDAATLADVRRVVERVHEATINATALLNLHIRRMLATAADNASLDRVFDGNWLVKAFYEVTVASAASRADCDSGLSATAALHMPAATHKPNRVGLKQLFQFNADTLATVGKNNVWMHFNKRLLSHVTRRLALSVDAYNALTKEQKRARRLQMLRIADDLRRRPGEPLSCDANRHAWVVAERARLGIDAAVGDWGDKPLLYHLKTKPHRFLPMMALMSREREAGGGKAMALFPMRRDYVPKHVRFDADGLNRALQAMRNERLGRTRARSKGSKQYKEDEDGDFTFENVCKYGCVAQAWRIEPGFTTDGVTARVQQRSGSRVQVEVARAKKAAEAAAKVEGRKRKRDGEAPLPKPPPPPRKKAERLPSLPSLPRRGLYAIDQIKHLSRLEEQCHFIGVDPGKRELICAADMDDAAGKTLLRYTQRQRLKDMRSRQYADESKRASPFAVRDSAEQLSAHNSKSADLQTFKAYVHVRQQSLAANLTFYGDIGHRRRRWKSYVKAQKSESKLFANITALHKDKKGDPRQLVLAYGSWGLTAGHAGSTVNKGNPPCIGVGLMRKLATRFLVVPTPEQYTSKTCRKCLGTCGAHPTIRRRGVDKRTGEAKNYEVRGLRVCQNESCRAHLNRDGNAAFNIGTQLQRLLRGDGPIRAMSDEDKEFHRHTLCMACDGEAD